MRFVAPALVAITCLLFSACRKDAGGGPLRLGFVLHGLNDFTQVIQRGAKDAGRDLGVEVDVTGPAGFVPTQAIAMFEAMVERRVRGLAVVPQPGELWVVPIREAAASGVPVVTANVTSRDSSASAWFGQDERRSGELLARALVELLLAAGKESGKIVVGSCAPGVSVLAERYAGVRQGLESSAYTVTEPFDVTTENTTNYGTWENIASAHPDMVAAVGLCSMDVPNLAKVKSRASAAWLIAGYDLNLETLDAVQSGVAQVTIGQHPYLQGYLPVRALVEHLRDQKPLVRGWVDVGTEVVTQVNVADLYSRESSEAEGARWYARHMAAEFRDLQALAKPFPARRE